MKKISLIKKIMLIASTAFMATSLVFVPGIQNKPTKVNKNKKFTTKTVVMKNEERNIKYVCKTMEENESWLEITDVQWFTGSGEKFTTIDFTGLTEEGESTGTYEFKVINIPQSRIAEMYDYASLSDIKMGEWKWIKINKPFFNGISDGSIDLNINIGKEVFDPEFSKKKKDFYVSINNLTLNNININVEQHEKFTNLLGLSFEEIYCINITFKGARMTLDYHYDIEGEERKWSNVQSDKITFENEVIGMNLAIFKESGTETEKNIDLSFLNTSETFSFWSADYEHLDDKTLYGNDSYIDIKFVNKITKIDLLDYEFESSEPEKKKSKWFWSLNDVNGGNYVKLFISANAFDIIKNNQELTTKWLEAKEAGKARLDNDRKNIWYEVEPHFPPSTINSSLVIPGTTSVNINESVDFKLTFTGEPGYKINNNYINLVSDFNPTEDKYNDLEKGSDYNISFIEAEGNKNQKIARITFFKIYKYEKLAFLYADDNGEYVKDSSNGVNIEVQGKIKLDLIPYIDSDDQIKQGQEIILDLEANGKVDWKNSSTGVNIVVADDEGHIVNVNDYFNFEWFGKVYDEFAKIKLTSNKKHLVEKILTIKFVKIDDPTIETASINIKLYDGDNPQPELRINLISDYDFAEPLAQGDSITFNATANRNVEWKDELTGIRPKITYKNGFNADFEDFFLFEWNNDKIDLTNAEFKITCKKRLAVEKTFLFWIKKENKPIISPKKEIKLFDNSDQNPEIKLSSDYDFSKKLAQGESIIFKIKSDSDFKWKNPITGIKFIIFDNFDNIYNFDEYFDFKWDDEETIPTEAAFKITSKKKNYNEKNLILKGVRINDESIETNYIDIKLFDEQTLTLNLKTKADLSQPIVKDQSIEFTLEASKSFSWKDSVSGAQFVLINNDGFPIEINSYFNFAWDEDSINTTTAKFILTSNKRNEVLTSVKLRVVKKDEQTIRTETKTIKLFDEPQPEPKVVLNLLTDFDLENNVKKDDVIEFTLTATKDFKWKDEVSGAKFVLLDNEGHEINLEDYFTFAWVEESIGSQTANFTLTSKVEHKELTLVNLKVVKKDDQSISTETKTIKLSDGTQPDDKTSNSNNLIIIGASTGAGALVASTATGFIISKKTKRGKQL